MLTFDLYSGVGLDQLKLGMSMSESRDTMLKFKNQKPHIRIYPYAIPNIMHDDYPNIDITYNTKNKIEMIRMHYHNEIKVLLDHEDISQKNKDELKTLLESKGFKFKRLDGSNVCNEKGFAYSSYRSKAVNFLYIFPKGDFKKILDENKKKYDAYTHPLLQKA